MTEWKLERVSLWLEKDWAIPLLATHTCSNTHINWHDIWLPVLTMYLCTCINFPYVHVDVEVGLYPTSCWLAWLDTCHDSLCWWWASTCNIELSHGSTQIHTCICVHFTFYLAKYDFVNIHLLFIFRMFSPSCSHLSKDRFDGEKQLGCTSVHLQVLIVYLFQIINICGAAVSHL